MRGYTTSLSVLNFSIRLAIAINYFICSLNIPILPARVAVLDFLDILAVILKLLSWLNLRCSLFLHMYIHHTSTPERLVPESHRSGPAGLFGENSVGMGTAGIPVALCSLTLGQTLQEKSTSHSIFRTLHLQTGKSHGVMSASAASTENIVCTITQARWVPSFLMNNGGTSQ